MWKLSSKRPGFTIIEVMCSFTVFTIMFFVAMAIRLCTIKMHVYDDQLQIYTEYIQDAKTEILCNTSNDQLNQLIEKGSIYITYDELNQECFTNGDILNLFTASVPDRKPYLLISAVKGNLEDIKLVMYVDILGKQENITAEFYKGNY